MPGQLLTDADIWGPSAPAAAAPTSSGMATPSTAPSGVAAPVAQAPASSAPPSGSQGPGVTAGVHVVSVGPTTPADIAAANAPQPSGAPTPSGQLLTDADIWGPSASGTAPSSGSKPNADILGIEAGFVQPLDNIAIWLEDAVPGARTADRAVAHFLGTPTTDEAIAAHKQALANAAAQGVRPSLLGKIVGGMPADYAGFIATGGNPWAAGAISGATNTDDPNSLTKTAASAGLGALAGKASDVAFNTVAGAVAPKISTAAQTLMKEGVPLTPGQITGGALHRAEDAMTSLPLIGDLVKSAQARGIVGFNRAAVNRALGPIGETLPATVTAGQDAVAYATRKLSNGYEEALSGLSAQPDAEFATGVASLRAAAQTLPDSQRNQFETIVRQWIQKPLQNNNFTMDGAALKRADSEIGRLASSYRGSSDAGQREFGYTLADLQGELRDWVARTNPQAAQRLGALNQGWRNLVPLQRAAGTASAAGKNGVFTPYQLLSAIRASDPTIRRSAFAQGHAVMQDLATAGQQVLPSQVPDSGTATRGIMALLAGHEIGIPAPGALAASAVVGAPYTKIGQKVVQSALTSRPAWAPAARDALTKLKAPSIVAGANALPALVNGTPGS